MFLEALPSRNAFDGNSKEGNPLQHGFRKNVFRGFPRVMPDDDIESPLFFFGRVEKFCLPESHQAAISHTPFAGIFVFHEGYFLFDFKTDPGIFPKQGVFFSSLGTVEIEGVFLLEISRAEGNHVGFSLKGAHGEPAHLGGSEYLPDNLKIRDLLVFASHFLSPLWKIL